MKKVWIPFIATLLIMSSCTPSTRRAVSGGVVDGLHTYTTIETSRTKSAKSINYYQVYNTFNGATLIADDHQSTYLGKIGGRYESDSIFNEYGLYGSKYSTNSIWNKYGLYGSDYSQYSPFNAYTVSPPFIVKDDTVIGRLSVNKMLEAQGYVVVNPYTLMAVYEKR